MCASGNEEPGSRWDVVVDLLYGCEHLRDACERCGNAFISANRALGIALALQALNLREPWSGDELKEKLREASRAVYETLERASPRSCRELAGALLTCRVFLGYTAFILLPPEAHGLAHMVPDKRVLQVSGREELLCTRAIALEERFLYYLRFSAQRVVNRLENVNIGEVMRFLV